MWRFMRLVIFISAAACLTAGCAGLRKGKAKKAADQPNDRPVLIGTIEMINPEQNYVLIRCEQAHPLPAGAELIAVDASGSQSRLALTPERKGLHLTADIKEGTPKVLNLVVYHPKSAGGTPTSIAPTVPAAPVEPAATGATLETMTIDPIPLEPVPPAAIKPAPGPATKAP